MGRSLLAKDVVVTLTFSSAALTGATSAVPTSGTTTVSCLAKSLGITITQNTVNATALCAVFESSLSTTQAGSISIELYVDATTGPLFQSKLGFGVYLTADLDGSATVAANALVYYGLVTEAGVNISPEDTQTESATIKLGVAGITGLIGV